MGIYATLVRMPNTGVPAIPLNSGGPKVVLHVCKGQDGGRAQISLAFSIAHVKALLENLLSQIALHRLLGKHR